MYLHYRGMALTLISVGILCSATFAQTTNNNKNTNRYTPPPSPPPRSEPTYTPPRSEPTYTPPRSEPTYTPPRSAPTYTPPRSEPTYTPPRSTTTYTPPRSASTYTPPKTYTPNAPAPSNRPATTYTPGGGRSATTYTPSGTSTTKVYTPRSSTTYTSSGTVYTPHPSSDTGVKTPTGTVYTPHAHPLAQPSASNSFVTASHLTGSGATHAIYSVPNSGVASKSPTGTATLNASGSASVVHQLNVARSGLNGINKRPLPAGTVTTHPNGSLTLAASGGRQFQVRPNGSIATISNSRERVTFNANGKIRTVHTATVDVYRGPHGVHTIVEHRADHSVLVSSGPHSGYFQRSYVRGGRTFVARTYVSLGRTAHTRVYSAYDYRGVHLYHYVPAFYYAPDFYGWAYYAWAGQIAYAWGWAGEPWYSYYGPYFAPSPNYTDASQWLTDYVFGQTLEDAYDAQQADPNAPPPDDADADTQAPADGTDQDAVYAQADTPVTPDLKQAIADEVQQQLAEENAASSASADQGSTLTDLPQANQANHYFLVSTALDVTTVDNQTCNLGAGNVLRLDIPATDSAPLATLTVSASRMSDCPAGEQITLSLNEMEEMQNNLRAQLDSGLQTLHDQQGQNGLPAAPQSAIAPPPRPAADPPNDQPNVAGMIQSEQTEGATAEARATQMATMEVAANNPN